MVSRRRVGLPPLLPPPPSQPHCRLYVGSFLRECSRSFGCPLARSLVCSLPSHSCGLETGLTRQPVSLRGPSSHSEPLPILSFSSKQASERTFVQTETTKNRPTGLWFFSFYTTVFFCRRSVCPSIRSSVAYQTRGLLAHRGNFPRNPRPFVSNLFCSFCR